MKRICVILLAMALAISALVSCGGIADSTMPSAPTKKPSGNTNEDIPENERINLDLDAIDYDGETVHIFHWEPDAEYMEFDMKLADINNDAVNNALYERNSYTETALGIKLDWYMQSDSIYRQTVNFVNKLESRVQDPQTPVDIIIAQARSIPYFMIEGHLTELNTYSDSLDLSKTWWPENVQDAFSVKDNLYFVSGDISANLLRNMTVLFVNKTTLESIGQNYNELMESVKDYEWTLDDLIALTSGLYKDVNEDNQRDVNDKYGLVTYYSRSDAIYTGLGYKYMDQSSRDDQVFRLSSQVTGEVASNYVQKMKDWHSTYDFCMTLGEHEYKHTFTNGNTLFLLQNAGFGFEVQKTDIKYAVLPTPALDTNQQRYYTTIGHQFSAYGVCDKSLDYDLSAQTLQVLGYHAFNTTTPVLFEVSFQGKFSKDEYTIEMFKIIRESVVFDVGRIYDIFFTGLEGGYSEYGKYLISNVISYAIRSSSGEETGGFNFTSTGDPTRRKVQKDLDAANKKILDFLDSQS